MQTARSSQPYTENPQPIPSGSPSSEIIDDPRGRLPLDVDIPVINQDPNVTRHFSDHSLENPGAPFPGTVQGIPSPSSINPGFPVEEGPLDTTHLDGFSSGRSPEFELPGTGGFDEGTLDSPATGGDSLDPDAPKFDI